MDHSQKHLRQSKTQDFFEAKLAKIMSWRLFITAWIWRQLLIWCKSIDNCALLLRNSAVVS